MATITPRKARRAPVRYCGQCGLRLPSPWQGRKALTVLSVVLVLLLGLVAGWSLSGRQGLQELALALVHEQAQLRATQQQLATERQQLKDAQQQLAKERQQLEAERQKLAAADKTPIPAPPPAPAPPSAPDKSAAPPAGQPFKNSLGMEFVPIAAGTFQMGSDASEAYDDEKPVHRVTISKPFFLGKYEVTQEEWQAVMGDNPNNFKGTRLPVETVSWEQAQEFVKRLNAREKTTKYRLPTEAEWEYAARAGTTTAYSFGNDVSHLKNYAGYSDNAGGTTHPVGQKSPNAWGLHDMHGNVWEWVHDWYGWYTAATAVDPAGPAAGSRRVHRGGSWHHTAWHCRSAHRNGLAPGNRDGGLGLRLLREAP